MDTVHLITHLVKFLRKEFFEARRGGRYLFQTFDNNSPHFQMFFETITTLPLNDVAVSHCMTHTV